MAIKITEPSSVSSAAPIAALTSPIINTRMVRPLGVYQLSGLAVLGPDLLSLDSVRGYLVRIDPENNNTTILNPCQLEHWLDGVGLAIWEKQVWFAQGNQVLSWDGLKIDSSNRSNRSKVKSPKANGLQGEALKTEVIPEAFVQLPYEVNGVAVWESMVYVTCQKSGYIHGFERSSKQLVVKFPQPGVGVESLTATEDCLWVCDRDEQTVYCLDRATGEIQFSSLTPFASPTGIALYSAFKNSAPKNSASKNPEPPPLCYVLYCDEEPYIRDDPNSDSPYQLTFRDRTFIHPLQLHHNEQQHYTLSNGYRVELSYAEELLPLEELTLNQVEWRIALPSDTPRQRLLHVEPIGHPFTLEEQDGERVAVFKFDQLRPNQGGLLGWRATMEMYSLKYNIAPADVEDSPPLSAEFQQRYLVDDDELAMDTPTMQQAAREAVGTETNVLRKMLKIRNYVYDRLSYGIQPHIDTPDVALERGVGSCGEYVGVLLALARLNGIACRTIGRYKCPPHPELLQLPQEPDFNHVWLEFYVPGVGWLPMESNVDDVVERGPYPTRFFMGLSWFHTEIGKGISFEKMKAENLPEHISLGDLAINHIRFRILEERSPSQFAAHSHPHD